MQDSQDWSASPADVARTQAKPDTFISGDVSSGVKAQSDTEKQSGVDAKGAASRKRPTSARKVAANRRNARRSTGPKTERGKSNSRRNALRHGLFARHVVITTGVAREDRKRFVDLFEHLVDDLKPVGKNEELLVEQMALCYWQLARVLRYENGEIRQNYDRRFSVYRDPNEPILSIRWAIKWELTKVKEELKTTGRISAPTNERIVAFTESSSENELDANQALSIAIDLRLLKGEWEKLWKKCSVAGEGVLPKSLRQELLRDLDESLDHNDQMKRCALRKCKHHWDTFDSVSIMPSDVVMNRILRVRTACERRLDRLQKNLLDLQGRRLTKQRKK